MILELYIKNFVIIKESRINFTNGLNVIFGETGSGKSIILSALKLLTGGRANKDIIRNGCEQSFIQGIFHIDNKKASEISKHFTIPIADDNLIVTRIINKEGTNLIRINDVTVTLNTLNLIMKQIVDICGQFDNISILDNNKHIEYIDMLAGEKHKELLQQQKKLYALLKENWNKLSSLTMDDNKRKLELDLIEYQINDIDNFDLNISEEELKIEYQRTQNINKISYHISAALSQFEQTNENINSIIFNLNKAVTYDEKIEELITLSETIRDLFHNLKVSIETYNDNIDLNQEHAYKIEKTIDQLFLLKSKYGNTLEEIYAEREKLEERKLLLANLDKEITNIKKNINEINDKLTTNSINLSVNRNTVAKDFTKKVIQQLKTLNFNNIDFLVSISGVEISDTGSDKVIFMISTNIGIPVNELSLVISGGELSRFLLAFKIILSEFENIPILIFDEIDTGISGVTGKIIGEKLKDISKNRQVICISHLPQIVAIADNNFLVEKNSNGTETFSSINHIEGDSLTRAIAILIGGIANNESISAAKKMMGI